MFMCSTLYHAFFRLGTVLHIFQVLDHAGIYLLIAGTYTPFLMVSLWDQHPVLAFWMMATIWMCAILGIAIAILGRDGNALLKRISLVLYVSMGWLVLCISPFLFPLISGRPLHLLGAGGFAYTSGVYFFIKGNKTPSLHVVWHVFVFAGALLHYLAVDAALFDTTF